MAARLAGTVHAETSPAGSARSRLDFLRAGRVQDGRRDGPLAATHTYPCAVLSLLNVSEGDGEFHESEPPRVED
jgi:hypothetical protein